MIRSLLGSALAAPSSGPVARSPVDTAADLAFRRLYDRLVTPAYIFANKKKKLPRTAAEDAVQDAFASLWEICYCGDDLPAAPVDALFYRILRRRIVDAIRESRSAAERQQAMPETSGEVVALGERGQSRHEPVAEAEGRGLAARLAFLVRALPQQMRGAYEITEYYDGDVNVAAEIIGISPNTVKAQCANARARLREQLKSDGYDVPEPLETGGRLRRIK